MSFKTTLYGKYFLLDRIAVGGMAEVFKAKTYGVRGFERLLVIKRILPHLSKDEEFVDMFIDEAKISVELNHANICQVTDLGKIGDNYFIAMEYIDGKDLRAVLKKCYNEKTALGLPMAIFIAMEVLKGLDYAHRKTDKNGNPLNLIHRDISPQNIMVSYHGDVKIVDFGIAKTESKLNKTQAGVLKGKFGYMSPEQASGLELDARTDIFSAGILLFEMLTGRRLFMGENDFETLEKIKECNFPSPTKYNPAISSELERIVFKALSKERENRFASAGEMQNALAKIFYMQHSDFSQRELAEFIRKLFADEIEQEQEALKRAVDSVPSDEMEAVISGAESGGDRIVDSDSLRRSRTPSTSARAGGPIRISEGTKRFNLSLNKEALLKSTKAAALLLIPAIIIIVMLKLFLPSKPNSQKNPTNPGNIPPIPVQITSDPQGANLFVSNELKGTTPITIGLSPNKYSLIRLEKEGYTPREEQIFVSNETNSFGPFKLKTLPPPSGSLTVTTTPPGAQVFIDGKLLEEGSPATMDGLALDRKHRVKVSLDGYGTKTEVVQQLKAGVNELHIEMKQQLSVITLVVNPPDATVFWDGKEGGFEKLDVPSGKSYTLKITAPGYEPLFKNITAREAHETIDISLKPIPVEYGTINLGSSDTWAMVYVDGKKIQETPVLDLKLPIGTHTIEFTNPHCKPVKKKVQIKKGPNPNLFFSCAQ